MESLKKFVGFIVTLFFIALVSGVAKDVTRSFLGKQHDAKTFQINRTDLQKMATEVNKQLPKKIDESTWIVNIDTADQEIIYLYQVSYVATENYDRAMFISALSSTVMKKACYNKDLQLFLKNGRLFMCFGQLGKHGSYKREWAKLQGLLLASWTRRG